MTSYRIGQILMICLVALMTRSSAMPESSSMTSDRYKPLNSVDEGTKFPIKKAYTYVSEFKRLPVFNFGIGKRWTENRQKYQPYSFGFGKRSSANLYPSRLMDIDYSAYQNSLDTDNLSDNSRPENKRSGRIHQYDFGLGKRSPQMTAAAMDLQDQSDKLNRHFNDELQRRILYTLTNRLQNREDAQEDE